MKHKIVKIKGCKTTKEVLLTIARADDGKDLLELSAWHETKDGTYYQYETIESDNVKLLENIITDFSEFAANQFANSMTF